MDGEGELPGDQLPLEVLGRIFEHLGFAWSLSLVCRHWHQAFEASCRFELSLHEVDRRFWWLPFEAEKAADFLDPLERRYLSRRSSIASGQILVWLLETLGRHFPARTALLSHILSDPRINSETEGKTAFIDAAARGHTEVVKIFLEQSKVLPSASRWERGRQNTALLVACENAHVAVVRLLLNDPRTEVNYDSGKQALQRACLSGEPEVVKLLLSDSRFPPTSDLLRIAWVNSYTEVICVLLSDSRINYETCFSELLKWACIMQHTDVMQQILSLPACTDKDANYALRVAASHGSSLIVDLLLRHPTCDPSAMASMSLRRACANGHVDVVWLLLRDKRADPLANKCEALQCAREREHHEVVKLLLQDKRIKAASQFLPQE